MLEMIKRNIGKKDIALKNEIKCNIVEFKLREINITNFEKERRFVNIYEKNKQK